MQPYQEMNKKTGKVLSQLKEFMLKTANGTKPTLAQWQRSYVDKHPMYTHNSILPKIVMDDMLMTMYRHTTGESPLKDFGPIFDEDIVLSGHGKAL